MSGSKNIVHATLLAVFVFCIFTGDAAGNGEKNASKTRAVSVPQENQKITTEQIERDAAQYLAERLPWGADQAEVKVTYEGSDLEMPAGKLQYAYSLPADLNRAGRIPISLKIQGENGSSRQLRLTALVNVYQDVVKLRRAVRRGQVLTADDLDTDQVKTSKLISGAISRVNDAVGLEATRSLDEGKTLTLDLLKKPFLINRGDHVLILAEKGDMKITAAGIAKEGGAQGSTISVENVQTKKVVYGQVMDGNSVKVNF